MFMAVKSKREGGKLFLEIDNGDLTKMDEALQKWDLKDEQAFWRFSVSVLLEAEDKSLWIKSDGDLIPIAPAKHSIKGQDEQN